MKRIVRIPKVLDGFFNPLREYFNVRSFKHFKVLCSLVAMCSDSKTIRQLSSLVAFGPHRTKWNDFLIRSPWPEAEVLKEIALRQVQPLYRRDEPLFLVIDDSKKAKRGKTVEGIGKMKDPTTGHFIQGHQFVTGTLYYRGHTIPFALRLYLNETNAKQLNKPFKKLTALAVEIIQALELPAKWMPRLNRGMKVYVLVDSFYFNKPILKAAKKKGFFVIGVLKNNRNLLIRGRKHKLGVYMRSGFRRGKKQSTTVKTQQGGKRYQYVSGVFSVSHIPDPVSIVFSKKGKQRKLLAIASTDLELPASSIILYYTFRWTIEVWFKQAKQHLGLGALHRIRWEGVVKHLHLSACAFSLLTHLQLPGAKGKSNKTHAAGSVLPARNRLREMFLEDAIDYFVEKKLKGKPSAQIIELKEFLFPQEESLEMVA